MDDFEIDILPGDERNTGAVQLPLNFLTIGEIENDDVKVYIKQDVYKALEEYARSDTGHELGAIILGNYAEVLGKMNVVISDHIIAKYTDASASTLTFTHETWDYVHKEHETNHPDTKIVGWQHTHPGYGIFLSNYDMFIQENFFNLPFQVAYVIDPVQQLRGFFQWKNGKVEKLKGFYIYDDLGKTIKIDPPRQKKTVKNSKVQGKSQDSKLQYMISGTLAVLVVILLLSVRSLSKKYNLQAEKQEILKKQLNEQSTIIAQQSEELSEIKIAMAQEKPNSGEGISGEENPGIEAPSKEDTAGESETIKETVPAYKENDISEDAEHRVYFKKHIVVSGDSLRSICSQYGLDYMSNYRIILSINGIEDANKIYVGQTILLPSY